MNRTIATDLYVWGVLDSPIYMPLDTFTVSIRRLMRKQSPFVGGRDHTTHHLAFFGLSEKQVAIVLILLGLVSIPLVTLLFTGKINWTWQINLYAFIYFFLVFGIMQWIYNIGKKRQEEKEALEE